MKTHEWKAMGRVIYGSRKTAFFEEKKANFAAGLNCTTRRANRVCVESLDCKSSGKRKLIELAVGFLVCPHFVRVGTHATQSSA